jgi:hypothetical protein
MKVSTILLTAIALLPMASAAESNTVPVGIRPCCAFGTGLKAELGPVPVPFYSIKNVLELQDIDAHTFNDGSASVIGSIFGSEDEVNGLIYTLKGGFIDTAHVRDTADFTYFLYNEMKNGTATDRNIDLTDELRKRRIVLSDLNKIEPRLRNQTLAQISALAAFRLAQWHEIAQWYGLVSVGDFKEYPSAFSPEDLYSNMLGALIALQIINTNPELSQDDFVTLFPKYFQRRLKSLQVQPEEVTIAKLKSLDGIWWDSEQRLPSKWVVKARDYHFSLSLTPNGIKDGEQLSLAEFERLEQHAELQLLVAEKNEEFDILPQQLQNKAVWTVDHFQAIADVAKRVDDQHVNSHNDALTIELD